MAKVMEKIEDLLMQQTIDVAKSKGFIGLKTTDVRGNIKYLFLSIKTWDGSDGSSFPMMVSDFNIITNVKEIPDEIIKKLKITISLE